MTSFKKSTKLYQRSIRDRNSIDDNLPSSLVHLDERRTKWKLEVNEYLMLIDIRDASDIAIIFWWVACVLVFGTITKSCTGSSSFNGSSSESPKLVSNSVLTLISKRINAVFSARVHCLLKNTFLRTANVFNTTESRQSTPIKSDNRTV